MESLTNLKRHEENAQDHIACDFSGHLFKDLDYTTIERPISFFRSDFSQSQFINCTFSKNSFGRADFINSYISNTEFCNVDFGSCLIKNALLRKTIFKKNRYHGVAMQYSYFDSCTFRDEDFITNMYHCEFRECTFINCRFEKSSLDNNTFTNCEFIKVDISECIAENLKFNNCSLRDVNLGSTLWTTYLYKDTDISNFNFKYRGETVDAWHGDAEQFIASLLQKGKYFEYLNALIISNLSKQHILLHEIQTVIPRVLSQPVQSRKHILINILDMLFFYQNYSNIPLDDYISIYRYFSSLRWEDMPFDEAVIYQSRLYKIEKVIQGFSFDLGYIKSVSPTSVCLAKYHINSDNREHAINFLRKIYNITNQSLCGGVYQDPLITIVKEEPGSIILTVAAVSLLTLLISYVVKQIFHNVIVMQIEEGIKNGILKQLSNDEAGLSAIHQSCLIAKEANFVCGDNDEKIVSSLASEITKGSILDIIIELLFL